jgi:DNA modification methylase
MESHMARVDSIAVLKSDVRVFEAAVRQANDSEIVGILEHLGRLDNQTLRAPLELLTNSKSAKIRALSIKNLAKYGDITFLPLFSDLAVKDSNTEVRREATSAIGRMRNDANKSILLRLAQDVDTKVIMQALRGLSYVKDDTEVIQLAKNLVGHPNEQVASLASELLQVKNKTKSKNAKFEVMAPEFLENLVVHGNTLEIMKKIPNESVHLTFTSPPYYNARDYSLYESYEAYLKFLEDVFREVHRITKEGRFVVINTSPIIIPRISRAHSSKRYPIPFDMHSFLTKMGWEYIDDIIWLKPEASVKNRIGGFLQHRKPLGYKPNTVTEMVMVYRKKTNQLIDWNMKNYPAETIKESLVPDGYESTNVWRIDPTFSKGHSAVFPIDLCNKVISYYSYVGDLVFDPFAGSGTVGISAVRNGRKFFMTEMDDSYFEFIHTNFSTNKNLKGINFDIDFRENDQFLVEQ